MALPATILMSLLASGVRAVRGVVAPAPAVEAGTTDFASLLDNARAGEVSTGLPVTIARGAQVELSDAQLDRLAVAADRAESAGATRALAFIDGRAIEIDIATRTVMREHAIEHARAITGIDAVIDAGTTVPPADEAGPATSGIALASPASTAPPLAPPGDRSRWSPSLLDALADR